MSLILNIETATTNCSVSLAKDGELLVLRENNTPNYSHAEQLHVFIEECMKEAKCGMSDLDAVAVSKGPGSYTGLRIGVSSVKGLCFALNIPLIATDTLKCLAMQKASEQYDFIVPCLDARRMEVYAEVFDKKLAVVRDTKAEIIDEQYLSDYYLQGITYVIGSGADKIAALIHHPNLISYPKNVPSAVEMVYASYEKFIQKDFEDLAYFEPYYLKDFIVQKPKNKVSK